MDAEANLKQRVARATVQYDGSQKAYSDWANSYDQELIGAGYRSHVITADYVCKSVPEAVRSSVRILDVGAGTGLAAKELRERGFKRIDGLEPNKEMLDLAREQNLYDNYFLEPITGSACSIPENTYDILTGSGVYGNEGHVPADAIKEMIRLVKPGGYIVLVTRPTVFEHERYKDFYPLVSQLEAEGKWKVLAKDIFPKFYMDTDGIVLYCQTC